MHLNEEEQKQLNAAVADALSAASDGRHWGVDNECALTSVRELCEHIETLAGLFKQFGLLDKAEDKSPVAGSTSRNLVAKPRGPCRKCMGGTIKRLHTCPDCRGSGKIP